MMSKTNFAFRFLVLTLWLTIITSRGSWRWTTLQASRPSRHLTNNWNKNWSNQQWGFSTWTLSVSGTWLRTPRKLFSSVWSPVKLRNYRRPKSKKNVWKSMHKGHWTKLRKYWVDTSSYFLSKMKSKCRGINFTSILLRISTTFSIMESAKASMILRLTLQGKTSKKGDGE